MLKHSMATLTVSLVQIFATISGQGQYKIINLPQYTTHNSFIKKNMVPGGYVGGGSSSGWYTGTGSGGGQTAVKFVNNDLFHRVIVSGGGGGTAVSYTHLTLPTM